LTAWKPPECLGNHATPELDQQGETDAERIEAAGTDLG
jgi:hypothetical protein